MKEAANKSSYGGLNTFATTAGQAASKHIKNSGAGSHGQKDSGSEKNEKAVSVKHKRIVWIHAWSVNDALGQVEFQALMQSLD